jgi:hypothetical protein
MADREDGPHRGRFDSGRARSDPTRRLGALRRAQPADTTVQNLLALLTTQLELCARLPVYEWEANRDGHHGCARTFRSVAEVEQQSCSEVLQRLRTQLDQAPGVRG